MRAYSIATNRAARNGGRGVRREVATNPNSMKFTLDRTVIENVPLPGIPPEGPIGLQYHGDEVEIANVFLRPMAPTPRAASCLWPASAICLWPSQSRGTRTRGLEPACRKETPPHLS